MVTAAPDRATPRWAFPLLVAALLVAWTLLCAAAWLLVQAGGVLLDAGSGWLAAWPELLWWTQWTQRLLETSGAWLLAIVWALGTIGVVVGAWITRRLWQAARRAIGNGVAAADANPAPLPDGRRPGND